MSDWWNNTAVPWLDQVKESIRSVLQAQQQADIVSAQLTYNAGMTIGNWISDHWKDVIRYSTYVYSGCSLLIDALSSAGMLVVSPHVTTAMWIIDATLWIYEIGNDEGWW